MTPSAIRPRVVTAACWLVFVGAAMVAGGGLVAAFLSFETVRASATGSMSDEQLRQALTFYRGSGAVCALAAIGLAFLVVRTRGGDARFRRATMGLGLAIIVLVGLIAVFAGAAPLTVLGLIPIIVGVLMLNRPAATSWFQSGLEHGGLEHGNSGT